MEVLLTFTPSPPPPPSPPPALAARLARALLKAKKSPNFFLMFLVGSVVVVTEEGVGEVEDVERGGTSVDVKDVSVDGTEGEVTAVVVEEVIFSDEEEKGVEAEGVELDSEGVAWAGIDSSHRPFSA